MELDLDLAKLRTLVEVRTAGSMTAAAVALGYTTGAVSQQMAALQRSVKAVLFVPVGRRVQLTDAGHLLADHAVRLLALARQTEEALAGLPGRPQAPIPRAPDVALLVLATERFSIAIPAGSAAREGPASLLDFADERWILPPEHTAYGRAVHMACRRVGFEPRVDHTVTDTASTLALVAAGLGVAPVTDLMLTLRREGLTTVRVTEHVERTLVLAHGRKPAPQPGVRAVIDAIQNSMATGRPG